MRRRRLEFLLLGLLFLSSRLLVHLIEAPRLHRHDELYAGAAAEEVIAGRGLALLEQAHASWSGGSILVVQAAATLFRVTGSNILALRAMSLCFATASCLLWVAVVWRIEGARAARTLAVLFVFMPPEPAKLTVMAWGNHAESAVFTAVVLWVIVRLHDRDLQLPGGQAPAGRPAGTGRAPWLALLGGLAGTLGAWFSYAALVPLLGFAVVVGLLGRPALAHRRGLGWVAGLGLGSLPVILLTWQRAGEGQRSLLRLFGDNLEFLPTRVAVLLLHKLRLFLSPHLGLPEMFESGYWAMTMIAVVWGLVRCRKGGGSKLPFEALLVAPIMLFAVVWSSSSFPIAPEEQGILAYRYLSPVTPFLLGLLALAVARLPRRVWLVVTLVLVVPNVVYTVRRLPLADPLAFRLSGSSYIAYGAHLIDRQHGDDRAALAQAERIPPGPNRAAALAAIVPRAAILAWPAKGESREPWLEAQLASPKLGVGYRAALCAKLAPLFDLSRRERLTSAAAGRLLAVLARFPAAEVAPLARAVIAAAGREPTVTAAELCELLASLPAGLREAGAQGLGIVAGRRADLAAGGRSCAATLALDSAFGYGVGLDWAFAQLGAGAAAAQPTVAVARGDFEAGIGEALTSHAPEDPVQRQMVARRLARILP